MNHLKLHLPWNGKNWRESRTKNAEIYELSVPSDDFSITMSQTPINNGLNELQSKFKKANAEKH